MKLRKGFVSNSSSSSFIIAIAPSNKCECCGRSDLDILSLIESTSNYRNDDNDVDAVGKEQVINHIKESWYGDDKINDIISKVNLVNDDLTVALISVSYHDENINTLLKQSKNITIIYQDNN
jgi:hypothetical protein